MDLCAPIVIPTLCRINHLKRCIESLKNNKLASKTELFIGLDYPQKEEHWKGYEEIRKYLNQGIDGFFNVRIIEHKENLGAYENGNFLINLVLEEYDCYIFTEDDNEFSPGFLNYMNHYLNYYKEDEKIIAVTGYAYPLSNIKEKSIYLQDMYFAAYGYGAWKAKRQYLVDHFSIDIFKSYFKDIHFMNKLRKKSRNQFCNFIKGMIGYGTDLVKNDEILNVDITYAIWMFHVNRYMVFPTTSLVRNWGFDGTGENCSIVETNDESNYSLDSYNFSKQPIETDDSQLYTYILENKEKEFLNKQLDLFFGVSKREYVCSILGLCFIYIFGLENIRKVFRKIRR